MCEIEFDGHCDVFEERFVKARKEHTCLVCRRTIPKGETYLVNFSVYEGEASHEKCCAECAKDKDEFFKAHGSGSASPSTFEHYLHECISDHPEPEEDEEWEPEVLPWIQMRDRIWARMPARAKAPAVPENKD